MQALSVVENSESLVPKRRAVVVEDDDTSLARRWVAMADTIANRCGWRLSIIASKDGVAPRRLQTMPEQCQVFGPSHQLWSSRVRRRDDVLVVGIPKGWAASPLEASALRAAAHASCAVWIARDDLEATSPGRQPRRILAAIGDHASASRVLGFVAQLRGHFRAELTVAHVVGGAGHAAWHASPSEASHGEQTIRARQHVEELCRQVGLDRDATHVTLPIGETAEALVALSSGFDLLVMGRGAPRMRAWEPGSVAARVASDADCSVLIVL